MLAMGSGVKRMHKLVFTNGLRKQYQSFSLLYEQKIVLSSREIYIMCACKDVVFIAPIQYKTSNERKVSPQSFDNETPSAKIIRYYFYDEHGVRIAIEQKFFPTTNVKNNSRTAVEDSTSLQEYYDIFNYEMSSVTLHFEYEFDPCVKNMSEAIKKIKHSLQSNSLIYELLCITMFGNSNCHDNIKNTSDKLLLRPFVYTLPPGTDESSLQYVSLKLDGDRAKFEILNDILYIHEWSEAIKLKTKFVQRIIGHVERMRLSDSKVYTYFIIDIFSISSTYCLNELTIQHCTACFILNQMYKIFGENLAINVKIQKFYTSLQQCENLLQVCGIQNDGFLFFYPDAIVKKKCVVDKQKVITIDLMIAKTIYHANLIGHLQALHSQKSSTTFDANGYETTLTFNNCKPGKHNVDADLILNEAVIQSLQFSDETFFNSSDWRVDMCGCDNLWGDQQHYGIVNVCILEFRVECIEKMLIFQRIRYDKYTANSQKTFIDMCKSVTAPLKNK